LNFVYIEHIIKNVKSNIKNNKITRKGYKLQKNVTNADTVHQNSINSEKKKY